MVFIIRVVDRTDMLPTRLEHDALDGSFEEGPPIMKWNKIYAKNRRYSIKRNTRSGKAQRRSEFPVLFILGHGRSSAAAYSLFARSSRQHCGQRSASK
jgi:hypothetical protein